jgi:aminoglycoside phosphotransferase (APT) family kinase protein
MFGRIAGLKHSFLDDGARTSIPAPLALVYDVGLVLHQYIDAPDLRHAIADDTINNTREGPLALCAQWLAALHNTLPLPGLKTKPIEHELAKIDCWCEEIVCRLLDGERQRLRLAQQVLHDQARQMAQFAPAMIHRDFYYANALWDGQRPWILDFDQISLGDPALDVGHFVAHLESLSYRTTGQPDAFMSAANCFLESYLEARPSNIRSRVTYYKAYTFLKLAATEIGKRRNPQDRLTDVFAGLALRAVHALSDIE